MRINTRHALINLPLLVLLLFCGTLNGARLQQQALGAEKTKDVNDPQYKQLAEESLKKFLQQSGNTKSHQVVRLLKVTTQVVAGSLTEIDFVVTPTGEDSEFKCHSKVLEQLWLNKKEIDVTCEPNNERVKRGVSGGVSDADVNDPQYKQLAEESLNKFSQQSGNTKAHQVVRILKVTTQVVAGTITEIDFMVSPAGDNSGFNCHSRVFEQSWTNTKDINVTCEPNNERVKRGVPGGVSDADVNNPQYKQLAEESLNKFLQQSGNTKSHEVVRLLKVTTQVVAGSLTEIDFVVTPTGEDSEFKCHSKVLEQLWLNKKEIDINCEPNNERVKRGVPGGISDADADDPQYKQLAEDSLDKFLQQSGNTKAHQVVRILKVTTQVVAGTITEIDFMVSPAGDNSGFNCHSRVFEQSWTNTKDINVTCEPNNERVKRGVPGGVSDADVNNPQYKQLAEDSLDKFLQQSGNTKAHQVVRILKVTTQVVAGTITEIDFMVSPAGDNSGFNCHSRVFEQSWTNTKDINVNCEPNNERVKREVIPIGEPNTYTTYIDPKSVEGVDISTYAVNHLNENNKKNKYIISKVPEVEKIIQVEKAIYYIITLVVNEDGCQKKDSELCTEKTFLIKIMEKLFEKLPNGAKNRQVLEVKNESEKNNH